MVAPETGTPHLLHKMGKEDPENGKYVWDESYLKSLLMNPVYCGDMASQKRYYRFKIGNQGDKAPEDWITVRDTHEAIIPQDVFDLVQAKMKGRKRQTEQGRIQHVCRITPLCRVWRCVDVEEDAHQRPA